MLQEIKTRILTSINEAVREVNYGCRVVENNNPSLYKQEEEDE